MAPAGFSGRRQFDVACGVLSQRIQAAGKTISAAPAAAPTSAATPTAMLLMPGADVTPDVREEEEPEATATQLAPLTIMYGDRVLVFDDFPSYRVAELVLVVAERRPDLPGPGGTTTTDIPVARKASLQRFMDKRRDRLVARAPYAARPAPASWSSNKRRNQGEQDNAGSSWLGLGVPGGCAS